MQDSYHDKAPEVTSRETVATQGRRPFTFDRVVRILIGLAAIFAAVWLINVLKSVLLPFLVAWLIAYILEPFVQYNMRLLRLRRRIIPIFITLFETILLLTTLSIIFVPSVIDEMHQVAALIRRYTESASQIPFIPSSVHDFIIRSIDLKTISEQLTRQDIEQLLGLAGSFISGGLDLMLGIFNWFIVILYVVFIMLDYERLLSINGNALLIR